ncbi:18212_t:CDS:2 [Funneliformis geosporum]|uniref:18212_t:CDS:1 n=1 Tax=Funneliformis geosporum TaxID=1117311 RepID=A0A9W4SSD2_9GLOM|nr:18212_t:CDS:2 [Funneliformis geosporum]
MDSYVRIEAFFDKIEEFETNEKLYIYNIVRNPQNYSDNEYFDKEIEKDEGTRRGRPREIGRERLKGIRREKSRGKERSRGIRKKQKGKNQEKNKNK